jgi:hypothetical protein
MKTPIILLTLAVLPLSLLATDVTGTWKTEFDSQIGHQTYTYTFKQDGTNLTGKASSEINDQKRESELKEGKVVGDAISFVELLNFQDNDIRITYTGKLTTNLNEISFTRAVGDIASEDIVAKRVAGTVLAPAALLAADVSGTWKSEFDSQIGNQKYTYTFKQDGTNLTGKASSEINDQKRESELKEGKVVGDAISFVELLNFQDNDVRITYTGKLTANAGEINFTREVGDFGKEEIVAKRVAAAAAVSGTPRPDALPGTPGSADQAALPAAAVTGTWKAEFDTQRGLQKYTFTLKQDGTNVTGKASVDTDGQKRESELKEGGVAGDAVSFVERLSIQDQDIRVVFTGKVAGNEIKFTRAVGDFGSTTATARREAPGAPTPTATNQPAAGPGAH